MTALRLEDQVGDQERDPGGTDVALYLNRREELARGPAVYRMLSAALHAEAADSVQVHALVARARADASDEIRHETTKRLLRASFEPDAGYAAERSARMRALIEIDIADLIDEANRT